MFIIPLYRLHQPISLYLLFPILSTLFTVVNFASSLLVVFKKIYVYVRYILQIRRIIVYLGFTSYMDDYIVLLSLVLLCTRIHAFLLIVVIRIDLTVRYLDKNVGRNVFSTGTHVYTLIVVIKKEHKYDSSSEVIELDKEEKCRCSASQRWSSFIACRVDS